MKQPEPISVTRRDLEMIKYQIEAMRRAAMSFPEVSLQGDDIMLIRRFAVDSFTTMQNLYPDVFRGKSVKDWESALKRFIVTRRPDFHQEIMEDLRARYAGEKTDHDMLIMKALEGMGKKAEQDPSWKRALHSREALLGALIPPAALGVANIGKAGLNISRHGFDINKWSDPVGGRLAPLAAIAANIPAWSLLAARYLLPRGDMKKESSAMNIRKMANGDEESMKGPAPSEETVLKFLKKTPRPEDKQFHGWAERKGLNVHKAEATAYRILSDLLHKGKSKGKHPEGIPESEVRQGMDVEKEHTPNPLIQRKINDDHHAELGKGYYPALMKMEKSLQKKGSAMDITDIFMDELDKIAVEGGGEHQSFLKKTIHDPSKKPAKVKEIYRAIKQEHPEYPAEFKARIALRKGSKSKAERKEGPPYEGPLAK